MGVRRALASENHGHFNHSAQRTESGGLVRKRHCARNGRQVDPGQQRQKLAYGSASAQIERPSRFLPFIADHRRSPLIRPGHAVPRCHSTLCRRAIRATWGCAQQSPRPNVPAGHVNIHGHMHRSLKPEGSPHINVSVEQLAYRPVALTRIRSLARALVAGESPPGATTLERIEAIEAC